MVQNKVRIYRVVSVLAPRKKKEKRKQAALERLRRMTYVSFQSLGQGNEVHGLVPDYRWQLYVVLRCRVRFGSDSLVRILDV